MAEQNSNAVPAIKTKPHNLRIAWEMFLIIMPIICIIFVPFGGLSYLCGRYYPYPLLIITMILWPTMVLFVIFCFVYGTIKIFDNWDKYNKNQKITRYIQVGTSFVFIVMFTIPFFLPLDSDLRWPGIKFTTHGLRARVRTKADIQEIRDWLKTLNEEDCTGENFDLLSSKSPILKHKWPDSIQWSQSLKAFHPGYVKLSMDKDGNPKVRLTWGGTFGHWGFEIGTEDMEIPPSDLSRFGEYRLVVEPGVYCWHEIQ